MVSDNIKWQLKCTSHAKLATSSQISEKPISSNCFWLMKHGYEKLGGGALYIKGTVFGSTGLSFGLGSVFGPSAGPPPVIGPDS